MHVWSFDPGETTGWVYIEDNYIRESGTFSQAQAESVLNSIQSGELVIYETLHCSPGFRPVGFEIIGAIKYVCQHVGVLPVGHSPANMAGPMKWPELDSIRKTIKSPHIRDAIYHYASWSGKIPVLG
jgi:hypothetical protein